MTGFAVILCLAGIGGSAYGQVSHTQNPLVARYSVALPPGSTAVVEFGPDTSYGLRTSAISATAPTVPILVAGMKQNSTYHMRAIITRADGTRQVDSDQVFETGAAPASRMPAMTVTLPSGASVSPGVALVCLNSPLQNLGNPLRVMAVNPAGDLIWYYDYDSGLGSAQPIKLLPNGHFLMVLFGGTTGPGGMVREIDLAGQTIHQFTVDQLNRWLAASGVSWTGNAIQHDIVELPNGHLLVLVNSHKKFDTLPGHRGVTTVLGDAIVDLDADYNPVWTWSSFDHLDVTRHPMLFPDWTHINTVVYSPDDGNILLSVRHLSWVVKIDYANGRGSGKILWKLGYQGDFKLLNSTSPADWFFAQHYVNFVGPKSTGNFQLALFDNGNHRILDSSGTICSSMDGPDATSQRAIFTPVTAPCSSRAAIFEVKESERTVQRIWSYDVPYSYWGGANMELPNGNMFFDIARRSETIERALDNPIRSVSRALLGELVIIGVVILIFLWPLPAGLIPILTIPVALIFTFVPVLGSVAIAIGIFVDAAVLVLRPADKKTNGEQAEGATGGGRSPVRSAVNAVGRPSFFALAVVAISFLPSFMPLDDPTAARVMEVTKDPSRLVWELDVDGQESYRTVRLPSLYPAVQW